MRAPNQSEMRMTLRHHVYVQAIVEGMSHAEAIQLMERLHQDGTISLKAQETCEALEKHAEEVARLQALSLVLLAQDTAQATAQAARSA